MVTLRWPTVERSPAIWLIRSEKSLRFIREILKSARSSISVCTWMRLMSLQLGTITDWWVCHRNFEPLNFIRRITESSVSKKSDSFISRSSWENRHHVEAIGQHFKRVQIFLRWRLDTGRFIDCLQYWSFVCEFLISYRNISIMKSNQWQHAGLNLGKYPKLAAWYESMKSLKGWAENDVGAEMFGSILKNLLTEPL